jgi:hypothetical protein
MNLIQEYNRYYSSDGYNTTLKLLLQVSALLLILRYKIKDSLTYTLKYNNSIKLTIKRYKEDSIKKQEPKTHKRVTALDRKKSRVTRRKKRVNG